MQWYWKRLGDEHEDKKKYKVQSIKYFVQRTTNWTNTLLAGKEAAKG